MQTKSGMEGYEKVHPFVFGENEKNPAENVLGICGAFDWCRDLPV